MPLSNTDTNTVGLNGCAALLELVFSQRWSSLFETLLLGMFSSLAALAPRNALISPVVYSRQVEPGGRVTVEVSPDGNSAVVTGEGVDLCQWDVDSSRPSDWARRFQDLAVRDLPNPEAGDVDDDVSRPLRLACF